MEEFEAGTIKQACEIIGGKVRPIHPATYYRGVAQGIYPAPVKVSRNISRVNLAVIRKIVSVRLGGRDEQAVGEFKPNLLKQSLPSDDYARGFQAGIGAVANVLRIKAKRSSDQDFKTAFVVAAALVDDLLIEATERP